MNILLNRPKRTVARFRTAHGPMERWSAEEHERFQDLLLAAHTGLLVRLSLRARLLAWTVAAIALYAVTDLLAVLCRRVSPRLQASLDRVDCQCRAVEATCIATGDQQFVWRLCELTFDATDGVRRMVGLLVRS